MFRKKIAMFLMILLVINKLTGCNKNNVEELLTEYNSPYKKCVKNADGTLSFFIYSSPIMFKENDEFIEISNKVVDSQHSEYKYENEKNTVKSYFPDYISKGIYMVHNNNEVNINFLHDFHQLKPAFIAKQENIYGDIKEGIKYESKSVNYFFYYLNTGIRCEMQLLDNTNLSFKVDSNFNFTKRNNYLYADQFIINEPFIKHNNIISFQDLLVIDDQDSNLFHINYSHTDNPPIIIDIPFEFYVNKIPDTDVFSNKP